jgi:hypothetical protein
MGSDNLPASKLPLMCSKGYMVTGSGQLGIRAGRPLQAYEKLIKRIRRRLLRRGSNGAPRRTLDSWTEAHLMGKKEPRVSSKAATGWRITALMPAGQMREIDAPALGIILALSFEHML